MRLTLYCILGHKTLPGPIWTGSNAIVQCLVFAKIFVKTCVWVVIDHSDNRQIVLLLKNKKTMIKVTTNLIWCWLKIAFVHSHWLHRVEPTYWLAYMLTTWPCTVHILYLLTTQTPTENYESFSHRL